MRETLFSGGKEALLHTLQTAPLVDEVNAVCSIRARSMYELLKEKVPQWETGKYAEVQTNILWHTIADGIITTLSGDPAANSLKELIEKIIKSSADWFCVAIKYDPQILTAPGQIHFEISFLTPINVTTSLYDIYKLGKLFGSFNVESKRLNEKFFTLLPLYFTLMGY